MIGLIGKKIGMTQIFDENGKVIPVTLVQAGPCPIIQTKSIEKDGYSAIQIGYDEIPERKVSKPQIGHFKKHNSKMFRHLKEFRLYNNTAPSLGEVLDVNIFKKNDKIKVTGISKGKGFQGVMKRHGFKGAQTQTHGTHEGFRNPGSIGQCATPGRVYKGRKLPGQMGNKQISVKNLKIIKIDAEKNLLMINGAIPGSRNSIVYLQQITGAGK